MAQLITHRGTVKSISGNCVRVLIVQASACSACEARNLCRSSESKEKWIDVVTDKATDYQIGEEVVVVGSLRTGFLAVLIAYVVPLLLLLVTLFVAIDVSDGNEPLSAVLALVVVILYYVLLYALKFRIAKKISFSIKHLN